MHAGGVCRVGNRARINVQGPLAPYADRWRAELTQRGYTRNAMTRQMRLMECLSRYLSGRHLQMADVSPQVVDDFLRIRRAEGCRDLLSEKGMLPLLGYLRGVDVAPDPSKRCVGSPTPARVLLEKYRDYLNHRRQLAPTSVRNYMATAEVFLGGLREPLGAALDGLSAGQVTALVLRMTSGRNVWSAKSMVTALRSLLRFLHVEGLVAAPLEQAVPSVAGWKLSSLPRPLDSDQVVRMLSGCDRGTVAGRRDYAVLMLLTRLGLRACEVSALELDDVDWRAGELVIRGKGNRVERLPMPAEVGEALAAYVMGGRPLRSCRSLVLRVRAPHDRLSPSQIRNIVRFAGARAGLGSIGAHRLRHTVASQMLRHGAPLDEIGQVLRHRSQLTTAIYAKIDQNALRTLARPWPGGVA